MHWAMQDWGRLYRCSMREDVELEAELTGTLLVQRIARHRRSPGTSDRTREADQGADEVLRRYTLAMDPGPHRGLHRGRRQGRERP